MPSPSIATVYGTDSNPGPDQTIGAPIALPPNPSISSGAGSTDPNNYGNIIGQYYKDVGKNPGGGMMSQSDFNSALSGAVLSPTNLLPGQRTISDGTSADITAGLSRATDPNGFINNANIGMNGAQGGKGLLNGSTSNGDAEMGMSTPQLSGVLQDRANKMYQTGATALQRQIAAQAPMEESAAQGQISTSLGQNEQLKIANYQQQAQYMQQQRAAYLAWQTQQNANNASTLGTILGGVGAVAGIIAAA